MLWIMIPLIHKFLAVTLLWHGGARTQNLYWGESEPLSHYEFIFFDNAH